ncbi:MAG: hypothetical protein JSR58_07335 [Verrucomicrobia bacterium]|nr:hypothetical protein [Verrucomicrobiota bacterium]
MEPVTNRQGPLEDYDSDTSSLPESAAKVQSLEPTTKIATLDLEQTGGSNWKTDGALVLAGTTLAGLTLHGSHTTNDALFLAVGTLTANSAVKLVDIAAREHIRKIPLIPRYLSLVLIVVALAFVGRMTGDSALQRVALIIGGILLHILFSTARQQVRRFRIGRDFGTGDEFLRQRTANNFMKALRGERAEAKSQSAETLLPKEEV